MKEETKEEYLARMRKERGITDPAGELFGAESAAKKKITFKERLKEFLFILLFALFLWTILQIFGMLKSN